MVFVLAIHQLHHPGERDGVGTPMTRKPDSLLSWWKTDTLELLSRLQPAWRSGFSQTELRLKANFTSRLKPAHQLRCILSHRLKPVANGESAEAD